MAKLEWEKGKVDWWKDESPVTAREIEEIRLVLSDVRHRIFTLARRGCKEELTTAEHSITPIVSYLYGTYKQVRERERKAVLERGGFPMSPRGLGLNWVPCFVCMNGMERLQVEMDNHDHFGMSAQTDFSSFVSEEHIDGIWTLFQSVGSHCEKNLRRASEGRFQVVVGACDTHRPNIEALLMSIVKADGYVESHMITEAMALVDAKV